jgi:hypothetical protein
MKGPEKKARMNKVRERDAYTVALLESVRFSSARENRNLTNQPKHFVLERGMRLWIFVELEVEHRH